MLRPAAAVVSVRLAEDNRQTTAGVVCMSLGVYVEGAL